MDADLVIWNPETERTYGADDLHDNVGYNPGKGGACAAAEHVLLRGETLAAGGDFAGTPGWGRWLDRPEIGCRPGQQGAAPTREAEAEAEA